MKKQKYDYRPKDTLAEMAMEAKKMGMSYGQYSVYLATQERNKNSKKGNK